MGSVAPMEADYVIVGGGLAGCALASRIKEYKPSSSILILEAGTIPTDKHDVVSPFGGFALAGTELDWNYQTQPSPVMGDRTFSLSAGRTLGGGSVLNYGGWSRGQTNDYDDWLRKVHDKRWSYNGLLPYMKKSEKFSSKTDPEQHGFDGPFKITSILDSDPKRRFPLCGAIEAAWAEVGVSKIENACSGNLDGLSEFYENWDDGKRQPAHLAYNMTEIEVLNESFVSKILLSPDSVAEGVELVGGQVIRARKEVIVSAGTFQSPSVLLRSGLDLSGIGQNYAEHFCMYQLWKLKSPERGLALGSPQLADPAFFKGLPTNWVANEAPPLEEMEKALDIDRVHGNERETLLKSGRTFVETMILYTAMAPGVPIDGSYITTAVMLTVPTSRGQVLLPTSESGTERPVIRPNYLSTAFDRLCISYGVKRLAQLMLATKSMEPYVECEVAQPGMSPVTASSTLEEITDYVFKAGMPQYHGTGTCAMGDVVDTNLRVKGVDRLRVCDASIFPTPVGGHPMSTLYAVAEQAADIICKEG